MYLVVHLTFQCYDVCRVEVHICMYSIEEGILEAKTECYAKDKVKSLPFFFDHFTTISSHFFDNYLYIFHKTEVQMVILRC